MPLYTSLFQDLKSVQPRDLKDYYLIYHQKKGFQLQQKHVSKNFIINAIVDPIFRAIKVLFGYSYNFEGSINAFANLVKKDCRNIVDVDGCISSCNKLSLMADRIFKRKYKDPSRIVEVLTTVKYTLLRKKAELEGISPVECACRLSVMKEAVALLREYPSIRDLSQESKNKLLGYFLENNEPARAKSAIAAGADPLTQVPQHFYALAQMTSVLGDYFILLPNRLQPVHEGFDIVKTVLQPLSKNPHLYWGDIFEHNVNKIDSYLETDWQNVHDTKACIEALYALHGRLRKGKIKDQVQIILFEFLQNKASVVGMSPLELALSLEFYGLATDLINQGADMTLLSQDAKDDFFDWCLDNDLKTARDLFILGANAELYQEYLRPLLHLVIKEGEADLACRLLDAKAPRGPSEPKKSDSAMFAAVEAGLITVVEKLMSMGEELDKRTAFEHNVLTVAAKSNQMDMLQWLVSRVDVTNSAGAFKYVEDEEWFTEKEPLEREFLLGNFARCQKILSSYSEEDAIDAIADLREEYPASCVDHILYSVTSSHFQDQHAIALPADIAPDIELNELLDFFDAMNFTDSEAEGYINPDDYVIDTKTTNVDELKGFLGQFIRNIEERIAFVGTPKPGESLNVFYNAMERAVTHTIRMLNEMKDSKEKRALRNRVMVQFLRASTYCGGKQYATACQQYVTVATGKVPTFQDEILDMLAGYREVLFSSLIPKGSQSVHDYNKMMHHLGVELGIPGGEMMAKFEDQYGKHVLDYDKIREDFLKLYSTRNVIFECVKQYIEQSEGLRDKLFDWFKAHVPEAWKEAYFAQIEEELAELETRDEKVAYLETKNITVLDDEDVDQAVKDAFEDDATIGYAYLGLEVLVDMKAKKMRIKPQALAYMLHQMGVLNPVYNWSYLDLSKQALTRAWKGTKAFFGRFFSNE